MKRMWSHEFDAERRGRFKYELRHPDGFIIALFADGDIADEVVATLNRATRKPARAQPGRGTK